jgi:hypothetical protein
MSKENKCTSFNKAVNWMHNNLILCNEIVNQFELDYRFDLFDEESNNYVDIYQYYLTDCNDRDVLFLEKSFSGMNFAYCHELGLYVLCVTHYGTGWDYVPVDVLNDNIIDSVYDDIPDCI